jgi:biotin carboxyl carrier protein
MDLTNEDVTDILALLDSLPYDELDLQTPRFRLTLRRTPDGWTQSTDTRVSPTVVDVAPAAGTGAPAVADVAAPADVADVADVAAPSAAAAAAPAPTSPAPGSRAAAPMEHRCRYSSTNVPSVLSGEGTGLADGQAGEGSGESGESGEQGEGSAGGSDGGLGLVAVRAPLPGTFYRAPRPGAAPFVEVGSRVGADTVVGIVETMKLFNSVTADAAGTVAEICLDNAEFADRGATLLRIRAD